MCWIPLDAWGIGYAKTVADLLREIREGECELRLDYERLYRVVHGVEMHITQPKSSRGYLMEIGQILSDGRSRPRRKYPSEKMKRGELPVDTLFRGLLEELGITKEMTESIEECGKDTKRKESKSYPGLYTVRKLYRFKVKLRKELHLCNLEQYEFQEVNGTKNLFAWQNL